MKDPDIEVISVKISTIYSQISSLAMEHTVSILVDRLTTLYREAKSNLFTRADGTRVPKLVNLDMEEYRDMSLTADAFIRTLDRPGLEHVSGGIALQATEPPNDNSWGYRLLLASSYSSVFGGLNVAPRIAFTHDVSGTTPAPLSTFIEGRKSVQFGVSADFIDRWSTDLSYTGFFGGGRSNLLSDRDIVRWRLTYSF
jgi:hypothetical protein